MATTVPMKGSTGRFSVDKVVDFFEENGDKEGTILVKSDQEPAIEFLVNGLVEARPEGRTIVEEAPSPKDSKGSNGEVERAVQEVEGQIRSLFFGVSGKGWQESGLQGKNCGIHARVCSVFVESLELGRGWYGSA